MGPRMLTLGRYDITRAEPRDMHLVKDSWRRSLQDAPAYAAMPSRGFVAWANDVIGHFLDGPGMLPTDARDHLVIARDRDKPAYIYGWALYRDLEPGVALVFVYVKSSHRREGIGGDLVASALQGTGEGPFTYAFRTRFDDWFHSLGFEYQPVESLEFGDRIAS